MTTKSMNHAGISNSAALTDASFNAKVGYKTAPAQAPTATSRNDHSHIDPNIVAHYHKALEVLARPHEDISQSAYDIAIVSLVPGPQQASCIRWLVSNRNVDGTWGADTQLSWYDRYICTYAASIAFRNIGLTEQADEIVSLLPQIFSQREDVSPETVTFGGLVGALDQFSRVNGLPVVSHNAIVRQIVDEECDKWERMLTWSEFYNASISNVGYSAERIYGDSRIDLDLFLRNFQVENDSIATAPAAGAMTLLEIDRRNARVSEGRLARLRRYVYGLDPYERTVGHMDHLFYFVTSWALMYVGELGITYNPAHYPDIEVLIDRVFEALFNEDGFRLLGITDPTTIPGDADSTSSAILGIRYARPQVFDISKLENIYIADQGYYQTYKYERHPALSTNIHMAGVLADINALQLGPLMYWLQKEIVENQNLACKWHVSPFYVMGEMARILAHVQHPVAQTLALYAADYFLAAQKSDGSWGIGPSTIEETGFAVLGLTAIFDRLSRQMNHERSSLLHVLHKSLITAKQYLESISARSPNWQDQESSYAPLWIGKPLYCVKPLIPVLFHVSLGRIAQIEQKYRGLVAGTGV